jgi:hypothetical protein
MSLIQLLKINAQKEVTKMNIEKYEINLLNIGICLVLLILTYYFASFTQNNNFILLIIFLLSLINAVLRTPPSYYAHRVKTYPKLIVRAVAGIFLTVLELFVIAIPTLILVAVILNPILKNLSLPIVNDYPSFFYILTTIFVCFHSLIISIVNKSIPLE